MKAWIGEEIFHCGDKFFRSLLKDIARATKSVCLETYIFSDDDLGAQVINELNRAVDRGVEVRVLIDGIGSSLGSARFLYYNLSRAVQLRIYHPVPWALLIGPLRKTPKLSHFLKLFFGLNRRNHRKTCIIDGKAAYLGSMNVSVSHLKSHYGPRAWRDTGARVEGPAVKTLETAFERAWNGAGDFPEGGTVPSKRLPRRRTFTSHNTLIRLNDTWRLRRRMNRDLVTRIKNAEATVWITNAYFVPHNSLLHAICQAAERGVDVRLLVPRECDIIFMPWIRAIFYRGLLNAGVRIFEYLPRMLHAKTIIIDDWAVVGSSNLNHRSLRHDLEADVVITRPETKRNLARQFLRDLQLADEVAMDDCERRPVIQQGTAQALLLLKNWM